MKKVIIYLMFFVVFLSGCTNQGTTQTDGGQNPQTRGQVLQAKEDFQITSLNVIKIPLGENMRVIGNADIQGSARKIACVLKYGGDILPDSEITKDVNLGSGGKASITMHSETAGKINADNWNMCCTPGDRFVRDIPTTRCSNG